MFGIDAECMHVEDNTELKKVYSSVNLALRTWPKITVDARNAGSLARCPYTHTARSVAWMKRCGLR